MAGFAGRGELPPKTYEIGEFLESLVFVPNLKKASEEAKFLLMRRAAREVEGAASALKIPNEFFAFLKSSEYLFAFFRELAREGVSVEELELADTYDEFGEHLKILKELREAYLRRLENAGFYDEISICERYELNEARVKEFSQIRIKIDGIPSNFEWKIISHAAALTSVVLEFRASFYNEKVVRKISELSGQKFDLGFDYEVDLSSRSVTRREATRGDKKIKLRGFSSRSLQCAFIFDEISRFARAGISPERIAVVLPDEDFAEILRNADKGNMLNFAKGASVAKTGEFAKFRAIKSALDSGAIYVYDENYLEKSPTLERDLAALNYFKFESDFYRDLAAKCNAPFKFEYFEDAALKIFEGEVKKLVQKELFSLKELLKGEQIPLKEAFAILERNLSSLALPHAGGGKVTVVGLLESRGSKFEGVIIPDFSDDFVPCRSPKEMFLNSQVRARAGLISHKERENLQRFYYSNLILQAKMASVCYEQSEQSFCSRFAREFEVSEDNEFGEEAYYRALSCQNVGARAASNEPVSRKAKHDFFATPLSFTKLNTYLKSPLEYYYRYVLDINEPREPGVADDKREYGNALHEGLAAYFRAHPSHFDAREFWAEFAGKSRLNPLEREVLRRKLFKFETVQNAHFARGWRVKACEIELCGVFFGVKIKGKIDRIDENDAGELYLIDYKTGSPDEKSLQLPFYEALCEAGGVKGRVSGSEFFDLGKMNPVYPKKTTEDLKAALEELKAVMAGAKGGVIDFGEGERESYFYKAGLFTKRSAK